MHPDVPLLRVVDCLFTMCSSALLLKSMQLVVEAEIEDQWVYGDPRDVRCLRI